ncbi:GNAT family N-acetyltransferase [Halobacillus trueperi]|uniref:GNAT family N-acetyltransferase n=1 Tax=Halobacillus trueperi TaxID=156205 RepID=UPI003736879E
MEIRRLSAEDVEDYFQIRLESLKTNPEAFASSYEEEKAQPVALYKERLESPQSSLTSGAYENGKLVGIITVVRENKQKLKHRSNLVSLYITPESRGQGLGRLLLREGLANVQEWHGVEQVHLTDASSNTPAITLYQSCGFETYGKERRALKVEGHYVDVDDMSLIL